MRRGIVIQLDEYERVALAEAADQARRSLNEQAAWMLRTDLVNMGLLDPGVLFDDLLPPFGTIYDVPRK